MKRWYPVRSTTTTRATADGRSLAGSCAMLVTEAAPYLAAEAMLLVPGRVRRRDPPGVRPRSGNSRVPPTGYLQEAIPSTAGPDGAADGGPGSAPRHRPRRGSRRSRPWPAHGDRGGLADGPRAAASRPGCPPARQRRTPNAAASGRQQEASQLTAGLRRSRRLDTDPRASLMAPCGKDGATRPGAHAQPEPVRLGTAAVVRLERTLAHWGLQVRVQVSGRHARLAPRETGTGRGRTSERYAAGRPTVKPAARHRRRCAPSPRVTLTVYQTRAEAGP
jgi:hypothetical protein